MRSIGPLRDRGRTAEAPPVADEASICWRSGRKASREAASLRAPQEGTSEVKKQGSMRSASSKQGDYVSEGQVDCERSELSMIISFIITARIFIFSI